jgi:hypothetical protein
MQKLGYILRVRIVLLFHSILIAHIRIAVFLHTVYMPVAEYTSGKFMLKCGFSDTGMQNRCSQLVGGDKDMVKVFKYKG